MAKASSKKSITGRLIAIGVVVAAVVAGAIGVSVANAVRAGGQTPTIVKVATDSDSYDDIWDAVNQTLAAENANIEVQLVKMDGSQINGATVKKEVDLNAFQHRAYLDDQIKESGYKLQVFANTLIQPLNVYSDKIKSLDDLKDGDTIAVPNNPTNLGRALKVLEAGGVLKTNPDKGYLPTVEDITENPKNIQIKEVASTQIPKLLPDVTAGIINANTAVDAGLNPRDDSIFSVPVNPNDIYNKPWINLIAGRTGEQSNPVYRKVVEAYGSEAVKKVIDEKHTADSIYTYENLLDKPEA